MFDEIKKAFFNVEEVPEKKVTVDKPLGEQINEKTSSFTVLGPTPGVATPGNTSYVPPAQPFQAPVTVDPAIAKKYQDHFNEVYMAQNDAKPSYHEYIAMVDAFGGAPQAYAASFNGFKLQGLSKAVLVQTAKDTKAAIIADGAQYEQDRQAAVTKRVEEPRKRAQQLQEEILQKQQEIQKLLADAQAAEQDLAVKVSIYNNMSQQLVNKIDHDIAQIEANVQ